jgi:hypothetical protein
MSQQLFGRPQHVNRTSRIEWEKYNLTRHLAKPAE